MLCFLLWVTHVAPGLSVKSVRGFNLCSSVSSLPSRTRRRMLGSPRRTRTQLTSLEAKPRRRWASFNSHFIQVLSGCSLSQTWCVFILSRSGPREKWGTSSTTWSSSTRQPTTSCTRKCPTTSSSPPPLCQKGWRFVALLPGMPSKNCSPKVNFIFSV